MMTSRPIRLSLHCVAAAAVILASVHADDILGRPADWGAAQSIGLATGVSLACLGVLQLFVRAGFVSSVSTKTCVLLVSLFVALAAIESLSRVIGIDFAHAEANAWRELPPFYRQPMTPTGGAFFRRSGPQQWTGRVRHTWVTQLGVIDSPYADEAAITVDYDETGFRNPRDLADWEVAIAGDSFTELGCLPHEQLFTSIFASVTRASVRNLGVSYTGPLTQLSYLRDYGLAASTKHTIIVFFEGNDLDDIDVEYRAWMRWKETGERDYREFRKQPSFVRAIRELIEDLLTPDPRVRSASDSVSAYFESSEGDIPVMFNYTPPGRGELPKESMDQLEYFFAQYAAFGTDRNLTKWIAYVPCKRRVLHGQVEFAESAPESMQTWQPGDLPVVIAELCDLVGVRFIDLTPALIEETTRSKQLLYNSVYETHLDRQGSAVVGRELSRQFLERNRDDSGAQEDEAGPPWRLGTSELASAELVIEADAGRLDCPLATQQLHVLAQFDDGRRLRLRPNLFEFRSSDTRVAQVSLLGRVTAMRPGRSMVTATCGELRAELEVVVGFPPIVAYGVGEASRGSMPELSARFVPNGDLELRIARAPTGSLGTLLVAQSAARAAWCGTRISVDPVRAFAQPFSTTGEPGRIDAGTAVLTIPASVLHNLATTYLQAFVHEGGAKSACPAATNAVAVTVE